MARHPAPGSGDRGGPGDSTEDLLSSGEVDLLRDGLGDSTPHRQARPFPAWLKVAAGLSAALLALTIVYAYRSYQERRIVTLSLERARFLVLSDTWLGYQEAATLLGAGAVRADPIEAGAYRALALAFLAADYRDTDAATLATAALVEPMRAKRVPVAAQLATAVLALANGQAGTAMDYASRPTDGGALAQVIMARVALLASNPPVATESIERALSINPEMPAALALRGDFLRRQGSAEEARKAYQAALAASSRALASGLASASGDSGPLHARSVFGMAKLALSREILPADALAPLARLASDRAGSPQLERVRAALYQSALQARLGDRPGAAVTLDSTGLTGDLRGWLERATGQLEVERGRYRVPDGTPPNLVSASDDDPYIPPPPPPKVEPPAAPRTPRGMTVHPVKKPSAKKQPATKTTRKKKARVTKKRKTTR